MTSIKQIATVLSLFVLACPSGLAATPKPANGAEEAYIAYVAAWKSKDMARLDSLIADDYMTLNGQRKVAHKSNELEEAKADSSYDRMEVVEIHSVIVGETAVVSGLTVVDGKDPSGKPYSVEVRFLGTLLKRNGHWQIIADQSAS